MGIQMTFKRYELKYMLTRRQVALLKEAMRGHMEMDRFGHSAIRNIYLDTDNYRLIRRSIEKPLYKEKLRVRAYGKAGESDEVFVELKKKFESVVYKRRLTLDENILWRTDHVDLGTSCFGTSLLGADQVLMELKTPGGIPLWMVKFLSDNDIRKVSFSKYGTAYWQMMGAEHAMGGRHYA